MRFWILGFWTWLPHARKINRIYHSEGRLGNFIDLSVLIVIGALKLTHIFPGFVIRFELEYE
jgi:hypothetical protein